LGDYFEQGVIFLQRIYLTGTVFKYIIRGFDFEMYLLSKSGHNKLIGARGIASMLSFSFGTPFSMNFNDVAFSAPKAIFLFI
jgi:hypothetical protein